MILSKKQIDFLKDFDTKLDFLEGTIRSGKSYIAFDKFLLRIADSDEESWALCGRDTPAVERNLIDGKYGILKRYEGFIEYKTNSIGGKHLVYKPPNGRTYKIYVFGYYDESKWQKILGGTLGGGFIDEINVSSIKFIREYFGRMATIDKPYTVCTANGDDPNLPIYMEFLNKTRPLDTYKHSIPNPIKEELDKAKEIYNWRYWHFTFLDNPVMTQEKIDYLYSIYSESSNYFKVKILGLRGRGEGLIYKKFGDNHVADIDMETRNYLVYTIGIDYGETDATVFTFTGIYNIFSGIDALREFYHKNGEMEVLEKTIDDYCEDFFNFADECHELVNRPIEVFVDSANKTFKNKIKKEQMKRGIGWLVIKSVNKVKENINAKSAIEERIDMTNLMIGTNILTIDKSCKRLTGALQAAIRDKHGQRLDDTTVNIDSLDSFEYSWKKYIPQIFKKMGV